MSYYDFNEHFWLPKTIPTKLLLPKPYQKPNHQMMVSTLSLICIAIWISLLFEVFIKEENQNLDKISMNASNCFMFKSDKKLQIHCFNLK
ncbi:MAG: hypothetical protein KME55_36485 [Nostoc indistinguendum CM1-VF10]|jgi:hypothetical protein|nr:hypothetical protein [Nostoc indistinguendum CM1-VF10]